MSSSRRSFLQRGSALGLLYTSQRMLPQMPGMNHEHTAQAAPAAPTKPMLHTLALPPFVDTMPVPEVVRPQMKNGRRHLDITMREVKTKVHRDVPETRVWSYGPAALAPVIEARSHQPLEITWHNQLPEKHFLPIDYSLHGSGHDVPQVRTVAHLHGAKVPTKDDGYPEDWFPTGKSKTCHYPFEQEAATLWYHDHAMGLNRLNTYAGLFGMVLLRDSFEDSLHLPAGKYEVPLFLYDRDFTQDGQLFYDVSDDPEHPWIPEFSADAILINGKIRPYFNVEPRLYRFRIVNTANSRFFNLHMPDKTVPIVQIGSDQGFLSAPVELERLTLAPAERADVLIDFSHLAGKTVHLRNGAQDALEFRVSASAASTANNTVPKTLRPVTRIAESSAVKTRPISLWEFHNPYAQSMMMLINKKHWHEPTTEFPKLNTTEIWEFINVTEDTHPMHIHLVRFQVLDRRVINTTDYILHGKVNYLSPAQQPDANEMGWKDTVQCPNGTVTRVIMNFEGYTGKYLYHCHILEHEANDMMRPFEVVA